MSANAIETLREWLPYLGGTSVPAVPIKPRQSREIHEAVAAVEALLGAAKAMSDRYERRAGFPFKPECDDLAAAVRWVESGQ